MPYVTNFAGTQNDDSGVGTVAWSLGGGDIFADDSSFISVSLAAGEQSHYLFAKTFGFAIPSTATILGVSVQINRFADDTASPGTTFQDTILKLLKAGVPVGFGRQDTGTQWPAIEAAVSYGASNDLWDTTLTYSDVNNADFGVALSIDASGGMGTAVAYVDYVTVTIYYAAPEEETYVAVGTAPLVEWAEDEDLPGSSFVGWQPTDGAVVVDTSPTELGYSPADLPGEWGDDGAGDWYATLPQGVEVVIGVADDSALAFAAPMPSDDEESIEAYAVTLDPQTIAGATCECTGTLAFESDTFGTMAFDGVVTIEFETTEETGPFGTISAVDGCGTIAFDDSCEC